MILHIGDQLKFLRKHICSDFGKAGWGEGVIKLHYKQINSNDFSPYRPTYFTSLEKISRSQNEQKFQ